LASSAAPCQALHPPLPSPRAPASRWCGKAPESRLDRACAPSRRFFVSCVERVFTGLGLGHVSMCPRARRFFVTGVEDYQANGVLFKGNLRGDPARAHRHISERLQARPV
jgi:hypothetical protein